LKLYYHPGFCSLAPHIVAREAGVPVDLVEVDLASGRTKLGTDYAKINARGYVPALELDDGTVLTEGPALMQYLSELAPDRGLTPTGMLDRIALQSWLTFIGTELHKQFYWLFHPAPRETETAQRRKIDRRLAELEAHLMSRQFLVADRFSIADAYAFTVLRWCSLVKIDLAAFPHVVAYVQRIADRPKVREALAAEGIA